MVKRARRPVCHYTLATCVSQGKTASATIANNSKPSWTNVRSAEARLTWTLPVARNQSSLCMDRVESRNRHIQAVNGQTARAIIEFFSVILNTSISFAPGKPFGGLFSSYAASGQVAPECVFPGSSGKLAYSSCTAGSHSCTAPLTRLCCIGCVGTYFTSENRARSSPVAFRSSCDTDASAIVYTISDQTHSPRHK
jgi:hypothetical protein